MMVDGVALVVPALETWTGRHGWSIKPAAWTEIGALAGQSALYVVLLAAATCSISTARTFRGSCQWVNA